MSTRRRAREYVLKALYAHEQGDPDDEDVLDGIVESGTLDDKGLSFAHILYGHVVKNLEDIDHYVERLAENWTLQRIAVVDKNILRIAIAEVEYLPDIPVKVAINEAIELAKKYSTLESASFVNGILDRVLKESEAAGENSNKKPES